ncbi:peroxide stress protein YaaA [Streptococcus sp. sy004]|uniref:peroxide stress protein YaaA n=1 Tax=Streptococcus sp. sy004 TaxID=2600149 RepID=UPI0011B4E0C3|nr:peroxide stress protein YaaA [Streptococcus sp. sy004]TWT09828.1 peroxide stress protein YaaA [Streptococcus sp. sy004]
MKFLIPTAKEMKLGQPKANQPLSVKSQAIIDQLLHYDLDGLAKLYKIKTEAALKEQDRLRAIQTGEALSYSAIELFNGLMYRQIDEKTLIDGADFIQKQVFITTALYGIINATHPIQPHRLDFNCPLKVDNQSLKTYWRQDYDQFIGQEPIISLLSSEFEQVFSKRLTQRLIKIRFHEEKNGQLKTHSTISKKARGQFLNQVIQQQVQELEQIKKLTFNQFTYQPQLSDQSTLVFVKKEIKP